MDLNSQARRPGRRADDRAWRHRPVPARRHVQRRSGQRHRCSPGCVDRDRRGGGRPEDRLHLRPGRPHRGPATGSASPSAVRSIRAARCRTCASSSPAARRSPAAIRAPTRGIPINNAAIRIFGPPLTPVHHQHRDPFERALRHRSRLARRPAARLPGEQHLHRGRLVQGDHAAHVQRRVSGGRALPVRYAAGARWLQFGLQQQLLHAPVQQLGDVQHVLRRAGDLVDPAELLELAARRADHAEHLAVERQLVDAARDRRRRCRAPGSGRGVMQIAHGAPGAKVPERRVRDRRVLPITGRIAVVERHVDGDRAQELAVAVEDLDAAVEAVGDVDVALRIGGDAVRRVELARLVAARRPTDFTQLPFLSTLATRELM